MFSEDRDAEQALNQGGVRLLAAFAGGWDLEVWPFWFSNAITGACKSH